MSSNPTNIITLQELINAHVDAKDLELILNEVEWVEITTRLGRKVYAISTINAIIEQYKLLADAEIKNLQNAIEIAAAAGAGANGWVDKLVLTWSGQTQEAKNKEVISLGDFGIIGDGVTDDTAGFELLEKMHKNCTIDLRGKVFKVSKDFIRNFYENGTFKVGYWDNPSKNSVKHTGLLYQPDVGGGQKVVELNILQSYDAKMGTGTSVIQGAVFDFSDQMLYTTRVHSGDGDQEYMVIEQFNPHTGYTSDVLNTSNRSADIGHQSLSISYKNWYESEVIPNSRWFWSTSGTAKSPSKGAFVCRFSWDITTGEIKAKHFQVTGLTEAYNSNANNAMCISNDGTLLCYFYTDKKYNMNKCRIFKTDIFTNDAVDYSTQFISEFFIERAYTGTAGSENGMVVSDLACDGKIVYFLRDGGASNPSWIQCYSIDGAEVFTDKKCWLGRSDAGVIQGAGGTYYREMESIFFMPNNGQIELVVCAALGRRTNLESAGSVPTPAPHVNTLIRSMPSSTLFLKTKDQKPVINVVTGSNFLTMQAGGVMNFGEITANGTITNFLRIRKNQLNLDAGNTTQEPQFRVSNAKHAGLLQVSTSGNFGLFSTTYNKWVVAMNSQGEAFIQAKLLLSGGIKITGGLSVYSDNTTAKTGGLIVGDVYRTGAGQLVVVY